MKITVWAATNKVGSKVERTFEVDDEEWSEMDERQRNDIAMEELFKLIEWNWEEKAS